MENDQWPLDLADAKSEDAHRKKSFKEMVVVKVRRCGLKANWSMRKCRLLFQSSMTDYERGWDRLQIAKAVGQCCITDQTS